MNKEIVLEALKMLEESISIQKEANVLLKANGIEMISINSLRRNPEIQLYNGIEQLAAVVDKGLSPASWAKDIPVSSFKYNKIEFFELRKDGTDDLSNQ